MVLHPTVYARFLGDKIARHDVQVWLVNTGWTGGPYGTGTRMKIAQTRAMIRAALSGALENVAYETDPFFNLSVPAACPDVSPEVLKPRNTWNDRHGLRRAGAPARQDVRRQLQGVRSRRGGGCESGRPAMRPLCNSEF